MRETRKRDLRRTHGRGTYRGGTYKGHIIIEEGYMRDLRKGHTFVCFFTHPLSMSCPIFWLLFFCPQRIMHIFWCMFNNQEALYLMSCPDSLIRGGGGGCTASKKGGTNNRSLFIFNI